MKSLKSVSLIVGIMVIAACAGLGDEGEDFFGNPEPFLGAIYPCKGVAGETIELRGSNFNAPGLSTPTVRFANGTVGNVLSYSASRITVQIPAGATNGPIQVQTTYGSSTGTQSYSSAGRVVVPEIEPNDDTSGTNATQTNGNPQASGTLSGAADKDHFVFDCLADGYPYKLKVNPAVVGVIYVNGNPVTVGADGYARFFGPAGDRVLIGLTGGTGAYTLEMSFD